MRSISSRSAFSLVELVVFIGLISLMAGAIVSFSFFSESVRTKGDIVAEVHQNGALVADWLTKQIQSAQHVAYPTAGETAGALLLVQSDQTEVVADEFEGQFRVIEDGTVATIMTTENVIFDQLVFLHFGGTGDEDGVSFSFRVSNAPQGLSLKGEIHTERFRNTVTLRSYACVENADCSGGMSCCNGTCRTACLTDCTQHADCPAGQICCISNLNTGASSCTLPSNCSAAQCETVLDCPSLDVSCYVPTCELRMPTCSSGTCSTISLGSCGSCTGCGDGWVDTTQGEECDDANYSNDDACTNLCLNAVCGDYITYTGNEECDDGNEADGDGCTITCEWEDLCNPKDGTLDEGEECDDGNATNTDSCTNYCQLNVCGDGYLYAAGGEACDDGNTVSGDGCSALCGTETLGCCGDGYIDSGELCDDGRRCTDTGDRCYSDSDCANGSCRGFSGDGCTTQTGACT